jgi:phage shock protein A
MIDEIYLLKAAQIRKDYLNLNKDIDNVEHTIKNFLPLFDTQQKELDEIKDKVDRGLLTDKEDFSKSLIRIIEELEQATSKYEDLVDDVQEQIEDLQEDEEELFNKIRSKYDIPISVVREEVNKYLQKQNLL